MFGLAGVKNPEIVMFSPNPIVSEERLAVRLLLFFELQCKLADFLFLNKYISVPLCI